MAKAPKKGTLSWYKKQAWDAFSKYIRVRDWSENGEQYIGDKKAAPCVTCRKVYPIEGQGCLQAGHFIPGRKNAVLFRDDQVFAQCRQCNLYKYGHWTAYEEFMIDRYSKEEVEQMKLDAKQEVIYKIPDYIELEERFKKWTENLLSS